MSDIGFELADVDTYDPSEEAFDRMREKEHAAAIETCVAHGLDLRGVRYTALGEVAEDVAAGEPWLMTELAGLQFYDYGEWDEFLERHVMPRNGDRLSLVRAPDNPHDANAVEVWWNNGVRLGHLPRAVAAVIAGPLDLGLRCRAYIADGGTGKAWTAKAVLVGEAVRALHEKRIRHLVRRAIEEHEARESSAERRRRLIGDRNGHLFESELADRRRARILQLVQQQQACAARRPRLLGYELTKRWLDEQGALREDVWPVLFGKPEDAAPLRERLLAGQGDPSFYGPADAECGASLDIEAVYL
ncbi:HIRAN domain-containing protein [Methylorubrum extorquens]|uniref:HIRAN domain-containing protein n=1 Tax=Methylorubrum extorquens (strain ATCC 14718 / DSM 1338 / JCM 2805 / NCIMB 9133 / AM1) TaxID=272630 RepID=C5B073_METEA|nr:HIRAN domain-containing protein [Methylorubrum extorquens]ACS39423.1 Hypothetical protein MexAM1_META1p1561 [Methylorubrum extorquens AM1]MCP1542471.1 hypothetical protein [Methylorubrum extorquens]MCP1590184.1 hypothetical protein [Methylorubrum extorquens]